MPDFMNPSADLQAGIAAGWAEGQRQIEDMQDEIEHLEALLDEQRARAQRLEAALVMTEDQRDKGFAERDAIISAALDTVYKGIAAYNMAIAERDDARTMCKNQAETWLNALAESTAKLKTAIAERNALRKQLDDIKHDYTDKSYWGKK